ncbi:MAG: hypothetical protein MZU97_06075 [Bacillus subtilis]|nr:hypothetical protein [Bacillus subtilis]
MLVTYEFFMAFYLGSFLLMFVWNIKHYRIHKDSMNKRLIGIWFLFLGVNIGYFVALFSGYATPLYESTGIWFNANDVLHVLIIILGICHLQIDFAFSRRCHELICIEIVLTAVYI